MVTLATSGPVAMMAFDLVWLAMVVPISQRRRPSRQIAVAVLWRWLTS